MKQSDPVLMSLLVTLPLPPSCNHSHFQVKTKKGRIMRVPSRFTKEWTAAAMGVCEEAVREQKWPYVDGEKVVCEYTCYWPDKRRRDAGNVIKVMLDAMQGIVYSDDRYVLPRAVDYLYDKADPRVELRIERM